MNDSQEERQEEPEAPRGDTEVVEHSEITGTPEGASPVPAIGHRFVFERWSELTDVDAPWWTRSPGLGMRFRLSELVDLAEMYRSGGVARKAVNKLVEENSKWLAKENGFCREEFPEASQFMREIQSEAFVPEANGPSAATATLRLAEEAPFIPNLVDRLSAKADAATTDLGELRDLDEMVELLDAELVFDGHSVAWRKRVLETAKETWKRDPTKLGEAIKDALNQHQHAKRRRFDVLVPISHVQDPPNGQSGLKLITAEDAIEIVRLWPGPDSADLLTDGAFTDAEAFVRYDEIEAPDPESASSLVNKTFHRDAEAWRLRDGKVKDLRIAFAHDAATNQSILLHLPPDPLDLLPTSLDEYEGNRRTHEGVIDSAIAQLAQARTATPNTAIVDLWTCAEVLFGGVMGDSSSDAAGVMAGLAELLFVRDLLAWLGTRYEAAGFELDESGVGPARAALNTTAKNAPALKRELEENDVLGFYRLIQALAWRDGASFRTQLETLGERMQSVGERAYLARNVAVHRAEIRDRTIVLTLPVFAPLVRECVSHTAQAAINQDFNPLADAKFQYLRVCRVANQLAGGRAETPDAIHPLIADAKTSESKSDSEPPVRKVGLTKSPSDVSTDKS